jgi:hypothetical protein
MLLINSPERETWNSLLWQPMFTCSKEENKHCLANCQIAKSPMRIAGWERVKQVSNQLIDRLYLRKDLDCEHLTIAIDKGSAGKFLAEIFPKFLFHRTTGDYQHKFHFTVNEVDVEQLLAGLEPFCQQIPPGLIQLISISMTGQVDLNLEYLKSSRLPKGTKLGVNFLPTIHRWATAQELIRDVVSWSLIKSYADQFYIILEKGQTDRNYMSWDLFYDALGEILGQTIIIEGKDLRRKVHKRIVLDRCVRERLKPDGGHCSAGIDKLSIWPNGEVTACAYDFRGEHKVDSIYETAHFRNFPVDFCQNCPTRVPDCWNKSDSKRRLIERMKGFC